MKTLALAEPHQKGQCVAPARAAHRSEMSLGELPAAVLDVVVECAGFEHGWRLEVVSSSLQATSMECAAVRLGKCRWMGGDRAEFRPSWRHVAVALRRGPYYLLRPGGDGPTHMRFPPGYRQATNGQAIVPGVAMAGVSRREAAKFTIEPTRDGEGIIHASIYNANLSYGFRGHEGICMTLDHGERLPRREPTPTPWLLHLGSHASHLPFRRCRKDDGSIRRVLQGWNLHDTPFHVTHWELAPATLADDERFEWRV